jgi:hypothetical protein
MDIPTDTLTEPAAAVRRSRVVIDHRSSTDPADSIEITTTHHGLYIAYLVLHRHLRTGRFDARPALFNATLAVARCFQTAGLRATQVCPTATVIFDRDHFEDILAVIESDERATEFHVQQFLADTRAVLNRTAT